MSEKFELPPDLSVFESQLGGLSAPQSKIDRDETLYRAGWAAALAATKNDSPDGAETRSSLGRWAWPASTGIFATLATALALMLLQQSSFENTNDGAFESEFVQQNAPLEIQRSETERLESERLESERLESVGVGSEKVKLNRYVIGRKFSIDPFDKGEFSLTSLGQFDLKDATTSQANYQNVDFRETKSSRQMLNDLLPDGNGGLNRNIPEKTQRPVFDWLQRTLGETI